MPRMIGSAVSAADALAARFAHHRFERASLEQLHRHVDGVAIAIEVEHGDDVRMRQRLRLACLALQRHERLRMTLEVRIQHFERDARVRIARFLLATIDRAEHQAHAALAEERVEHEALLDDRTGLQRTAVSLAGFLERPDQAIAHDQRARAPAMGPAASPHTHCCPRRQPPTRAPAAFAPRSAVSAARCDWHQDLDAVGVRGRGLHQRLAQRRLIGIRCSPAPLPAGSAFAAE